MAVIWDLSMSIGYMIYRAFGGEVGGHVLQLGGPVRAYFMLHGLVALLVMLLEVAVLLTGLMHVEKGELNRLASEAGLAVVLPLVVCVSIG
jgi:hypothetical protein